MRNSSTTRPPNALVAILCGIALAALVIGIGNSTLTQRARADMGGTEPGGVNTNLYITAAQVSNLIYSIGGDVRTNGFNYFIATNAWLIGTNNTAALAAPRHYMPIFGNANGDYMATYWSQSGSGENGLTFQATTNYFGWIWRDNTGNKIMELYQAGGGVIAANAHAPFNALSTADFYGAAVARSTLNVRDTATLTNTVIQGHSRFLGVITNTGGIVSADGGVFVRGSQGNPTTGGAGIEMVYSSGQAYWYGFDRTGGTYMPGNIIGRPLLINSGGPGNGVTTNGSYYHNAGPLSIGTNGTPIVSTMETNFTVAAIPSIAAGANFNTNVTLLGAVAGSPIIVGTTAWISGLQFSGYCTNGGNVSVVVHNLNLVTAIVPSNTVFRVRAIN